MKVAKKKISTNIPKIRKKIKLQLFFLLLSSFIRGTAAATAVASLIFRKERIDEWITGEWRDRWMNKWRNRRIDERDAFWSCHRQNCIFHLCIFMCVWLCFCVSQYCCFINLSIGWGNGIIVAHCSKNKKQNKAK